MTSPTTRRPDPSCQQTLDCLTALVRIWTPHEGAVFVNRTWCEYTGTTPQDNTGDGWLRCVHGDDRAALVDALESGQAPGPIEYRLQARDGSMAAVTDSARVWTGEGATDLPALVHTVMLRATPAADDDRTRTMSKWAHELRGPLNAILGWSDLLSAGDSGTDVVQRGLKAIANNARQQALIIKRMSE